MKYHLVFIIPIIILSLLSYRSCNSDYMSYKSRKCVVLDKMIVDGGKYSDNFYFVLEEERGIVFDLIVSPATYFQTQIGETVIFRLRQFDIKQTLRDNTIDFFGGALVFSALLSVSIVYVGYMLAKFMKWI